jgi:hypothetical protein
MISRNDPQAVPAGADPIGSKTPEMLSQEARERVLVEQQELARALTNPSCPIALREGLPPALAKDVTEFNRRVADFQARQEALAAARINLPLEMAAPKFCGPDLAKRAGKVRAERYDVLRLHAKILTARKPLLEALVEHIDMECVTAEGRAQKASEKVAKALKDAGYVPRPARGGQQGRYPEAERRAFDYEVSNQPVVRAAAEEAKGLRAELAELRRQAAGVDADVGHLEALVAAAWRQLVGTGA